MITLFTPPFYGIHRIIKEYANFPNFIPMPCYFEHGISTRDKPSKHELMTRKKVMLVFNSRRKEIYEKYRPDKKVEIMGAPLVHYRKMRNIVQDADAKGTIVFPSHSTERVNSKTDYNDFCDLLKSLPNEFQPVRVCLHWYDLKRGKDAHYIKRGIPVVSAGNILSANFPEKFYNILKSSKYTCSNDPGSYSFFSIEMGIPFFILGKPAVIVNDGNDPDYPDKYSILDFEFGKKCYEMFTKEPLFEITEEKRQFVIQELGLNECLSRKELHSLLWKTFLKTPPHIYLHELLRFMKSKLTNKL